MAQSVINWLFTANGVSNSDGSYAATVQGGVETYGPGSNVLGNQSSALHFEPGVSCRRQLSLGELDAARFAIQVAFRVTSQVVTRGNIIESTGIPFAMFVQPGNAPDKFNIEASVANGAVGWIGTNTANRRPLLINQWYVASLVYDIDTLSLLIDDTVIAVTAYPRGGLQAPVGDQLYVGTWIDGVNYPFTGDISCVQIWRDIPELLEAKLDAERGNAEWHLTRKENEIRPMLHLGSKTADFYFDSFTRSYIQPFSGAVISYVEAHGAAFVMYGAILAKWRSDETLRRSLGALASDEIDGRRSGSRKSVFSRGCIYWSPQTGAVSVIGRIYLDFELIGEGASVIGLPVADAESIIGGQVQRFQNGKMYLRWGASNAFEVHGAILAKFEAAGGVQRFGFPVTHESDVRRGSVTIGKVSEFERCTIYWSPRTPASIMYGAIRDRYRGASWSSGEGGPQGDLGFPTSDEGDIPDAPGARYNTFQNGSILWFGGPIFVCRPFNIFLGRLDTKEEDQDWFDWDGPNDLYCRVCIDVNGSRVFDRKYPENQAHYPSANIYDLNLEVPYRINPNNVGLTAHVQVEVWEHDGGQLFAGGDDHLGTMTKVLNMANAWGLRDPEGPNGVFRSSNFGPWVKYLDWSVRPVVTPSTPFNFWGVENRGTPTVDWREYAAAFSDVDPDWELDFGIIDDGIKALFYESIVKGVAAGGNCFGMSLEAIYAWKGLSRLGSPLCRFNDWNQVENDFNIKHIYQIGADAIWWFIGQFLSGNTHNPTHVFQATWDAFSRGENPVICVAQNYDFSGAPHCIVPISWNRNVTPWQIGIFDPNFHCDQRRILTVDPSSNSFRYDGGRIYEGGAWSGGRFHYMPWSVLNHRQRTPVWDAILLLLSGIVVIFGEDAEVASLTDEQGNNLDASSVRNRDSMSGKLLRIPGLSGLGSIKGSLYVGKQEEKKFMFNPNVIKEISRLIPSGTTSVSTRRRELRRAMTTTMSTTIDTLSNTNTISGSTLMDMVRMNGIPYLRPAQPTDLDTIQCELRGKTDGKLNGYYKRGLVGTQIQGDVATGERLSIGYERMLSRENTIKMQSDRDRQYSLTMSQKLGAGKNFVKVTFAGLVSEPGKPTMINMQPGISSIDMLTVNVSSNVQISIDSSIGGNVVKSSFNVQLQGGQRVILPELNDPGRLKVERIDTLFGSGREGRIINRQ